MKRYMIPRTAHCDGGALGVPRRTVVALAEPPGDRSEAYARIARLMRAALSLTGEARMTTITEQVSGLAAEAFRFRTITEQAVDPATITGQLIDLVGPHGYIHGWIFVGIPGVGQAVYHPQHGPGHVTGDDGKHVTVSFARSGASHSFEAPRRDAAETPRLEPRETLGGWRGLGADTGSPISDRAAAYLNSIRGHVSPRELDQYDAGRYKRETLNPAYHYTPGQTKAIRGYTGASYADINEAARSGSTGKHAADADAISAAMQPLPEDLTVRRELSGAHALGDIKPGDVIADPGFSSATVSPFSRFAGGRHDTTVLHIVTPKGTPTVWANPASDHPEDEMILDRGQPMVVLKAEPRPGRTGVTDVHLLVLPKETVK